MEQTIASPQPTSVTPPANAATVRRDTIVMVRWALTITCAYLVLFNEQPRGAVGLAALVIVTFLASNLVIGRLPARSVESPQFSLAVAALDSALIGLSLYGAGQLSVELVVLLLGVLVLAIAGIRLGIIAALTVGLAAVSVALVSLNGSEPFRHSSILLRVPFLLAAAVAYAWLAETGRRHSVTGPEAADVVSHLACDLSAQFEAIERCQAAAAQGLMSSTQGLLSEIAQLNLRMRAAAAGVALPRAEARQTPAVARSAA
jgi:hypothetical protein